MNWKKIYKTIKSRLITKGIITDRIDNTLEVFQKTSKKLHDINEIIELKKDRIDKTQETLRIQKNGLLKQRIRINETIIKIKQIID